MKWAIIQTKIYSGFNIIQYFIFQPLHFKIIYLFMNMFLQTLNLTFIYTEFLSFHFKNLKGWASFDFVNTFPT